MTTITQTTQFEIFELALQTKASKIDIRNMFEELNIFDSVLQPCISGTILIKDALSLTSKLDFDGSEFIFVNIGKSDDDNEGLRIKKSFRIYKQSNRKNINQTTEMYILHFVSDEYIFSQQKKVRGSYTGTYSEIAAKILTDKLDISLNSLQGVFDQSRGIREVVIPNLPPLESIEWLAKRSVNEDNLPNFLFFENRYGFNYASLSTLAKTVNLFEVNFDVKNIDSNLGNEFIGAREVRVVSQYDLLNTTQSGVAASKFIGFDPTTGKIETKNFSFLDHQKSSEEGANPNLTAIRNRDGTHNYNNYDSKISIYSTTNSRKNSTYIKDNDPNSLNTLDDVENYLLQRRAILANLLQQRVRLVLPGNFLVSSGLNLFLNIPLRGVYDEGGYCFGGDNFDRTLYGKYLVIGCRHVIRYDKHETVIEVAKSTSRKPYSAVDSIELARAPLYGEPGY